MVNLHPHMPSFSGENSDTKKCAQTLTALTKIYWESLSNSIYTHHPDLYADSVLRVLKTRNIIEVNEERRVPNKMNVTLLDPEKFFSLQPQKFHQEMREASELISKIARHPCHNLHLIGIADTSHSKWDKLRFGNLIKAEFYAFNIEVLDFDLEKLRSEGSPKSSFDHFAFANKALTEGKTATAFDHFHQVSKENISNFADAQFMIAQMIRDFSDLSPDDFDEETPANKKSRVCQMLKHLDVASQQGHEQAAQQMNTYLHYYYEVPIEMRSNSKAQGLQERFRKELKSAKQIESAFLRHKVRKQIRALAATYKQNALPVTCLLRQAHPETMKKYIDHLIKAIHSKEATLQVINEVHAIMPNYLHMCSNQQLRALFLCTQFSPEFRNKLLDDTLWKKGRFISCIGFYLAHVKQVPEENIPRGPESVGVAIVDEIAEILKHPCITGKFALLIFSIDHFVSQKYSFEMATQVLIAAENKFGIDEAKIFFDRETQFKSYYENPYSEFYRLRKKLGSLP